MKAAAAVAAPAVAAIEGRSTSAIELDEMNVYNIAAMLRSAAGAIGVTERVGTETVLRSAH
eukprot:9834-Heterococcus_DN1.PRE.12